MSSICAQTITNYTNGSVSDCEARINGICIVEMKSILLAASVTYFLLGSVLEYTVYARAITTIIMLAIVRIE